MPATTSHTTVDPDPAARSTTLLFDLDGTITDSFDGIAASFRHALATVGHPEPEPSLVEGIAGPPMMDTLRSIGLDDARAQAAMDAYRARYTDVGWLENAVFPEMAGLLADLRGAGRRLAVATSKNETTARRILDHFDLARHFDVIAGASDDGTRRTKGDVVAHALVGMGLRPTSADDGGTRDVVIVGDRSHDVHGAGAYGIPAVLVGWGYALDGEAAHARWQVETVDELRAVLGV